MTENWISTKKHYCETCRCWLSAHKYNIKHHERSTRHLENFRKLLKESSARREQETKEQEFLEKELQKLDKVEKQYLASLNKKDNTIHNNNNTIHNNNNTIHNNNNNNNNNNYNVENKITATDTSNNYFRNVSSISPKYNPLKYGDTQKEPKQNETRNEYMNWLVMIDTNTGRIVYLNKENCEIKQEPPENFLGEIPKQEAFTEQNGWYKHFDTYANCFYYYNVNTAQFIWEYSSHNINCFIAYVKQWENTNAGNYLETNALNSVGPNSSFANYWQPNNPTINSYASNGNDLGNYTSPFNEWHSQELAKEQKENQKKKNENNESGKVYVSLNLNKQKNEGGTEQQENNQIDSACLENNNALLGENEKKRIENAQKKDEEKKNNISTISDDGGPKTDVNVTKDVNVEEKNEQVPVRKKRISRWDQRPVETEEKQPKEVTEKADDKEKERGRQPKEKEEKEEKEDKVNGMVDTKKVKETEEEMPKKKIKVDLNTEEPGEEKITKSNNPVPNKKDNNVGTLGTWEVVENPTVHTIPMDTVEDIFYKIKSRDQLEKEELLNLEEHIKDEYSQYDQFYVKKKELEKTELFLNQEFQFVNKPVFIKATDKKNMQKENVTFAKRNIKTTNKKGDISNAN